MRFRTGGLGETPWWRWILYVILFGSAVGFLGFKADRFLLYAAPIAAVFIVGMIAGIGRAVRTPRIRAWGLGNLWWIIPLFILLQIALFVWDRIEERRRRQNMEAYELPLKSKRRSALAAGKKLACCEARVKW